MPDRPIIFSAPMVRALLAGRKTQTRRLLPPRPSLARPSRYQQVGVCRRTGRAIWEAWAGDQPCNAFPAGAGCATPVFHTAAPGDRLYVREAVTCGGVFTDVVEVRYRAHERASHTEFVEQVPIGAALSALPAWPRYSPSIHMPRWASRLTLVVEAVKVEQLQAIVEKDAAAEGCHKLPASGRAVEKPGDQHFGMTWPSCRAWYANLWDTLHTKKGERWEDDPAVVALTFRVIAGNIDRIAA